MFDTDLVRELRLRKWARENFVTLDQRKPTWHPIVLDEMILRDREMAAKPRPIAAQFDDELDPPCLFDLMVQETNISDFAPDELQQHRGAGIVPLFPEGNWMIQSSPPELHGPHWQMSADRNSTSDQSDLVGYW